MHLLSFVFQQFNLFWIVDNHLRRGFHFFYQNWDLQLLLRTRNHLVFQFVQERRNLLLLMVSHHSWAARNWGGYLILGRKLRFNLILNILNKCNIIWIIVKISRQSSSSLWPILRSVFRRILNFRVHFLYLRPFILLADRLFALFDDHSWWWSLGISFLFSLFQWRFVLFLGVEDILIDIHAHCFFDVNEEFLSVGSNLGAWSSTYESFDSFPVFAVYFQSYR